jgi:hypothetical protein
MLGWEMPQLARPLPLHPATALHAPYQLPMLHPLPLPSYRHFPFAQYPWTTLPPMNVIQSLTTTTTEKSSSEPTKSDFTRVDTLSRSSGASSSSSPPVPLPLSPREFPWIYHHYHNDFFRYREVLYLNILPGLFLLGGCMV